MCECEQKGTCDRDTLSNCEHFTLIPHFLTKNRFSFQIPMKLPKGKAKRLFRQKMQVCRSLCVGGLLTALIYGSWDMRINKVFIEMMSNRRGVRDEEQGGEQAGSKTAKSL